MRKIDKRWNELTRVTSKESSQIYDGPRETLLLIFEQSSGAEDGLAVTEDSQIRRYFYALNFWSILAMFAIFSIDSDMELLGVD